MAILSEIQGELIVTLLLIMIYYHAHYKLLKSSFINRLFLGILPLTIIMLIFQIITVFLSLYDSHIIILLNKTIIIMTFSLGPFIVYIWIMHIGEWFSRYHGIHFKPKKVLKYPLLVNTIISIANCHFNIFFKIDNNNVYSFTLFFAIPYILCCFYYIYIFLYIRVIEKNMYEKEVNLFSLLLIVAFLGTLLQIIYPHTFLVWSLVGALLIANYIFLLNSEYQYDPLTNALNRLSFEQYLSHIKQKRNTNITIINFDLDDFKFINDNYGHSAGDEALKIFSNALYKVNIPKKIFRVGGDEFVVIIEGTSSNKIKKYLSGFENIIDSNNHMQVTPFFITYSYGVVSNSNKKYSNVESMIAFADKLMYEQKQHKKISRLYNLLEV
ncbi:MAG: GGDEF domain-containing protein [Clostridiales bacterium]|nr:GGDEF domain-containing protein [Clostridiales bacterium]